MLMQCEALGGSDIVPEIAVPISFLVSGYSYGSEVLMHRRLFLSLVLMGVPLMACEGTACIEPQPQPLEQVWAAANDTFWDQIATGSLGLIRDGESGGHLRMSSKPANSCAGQLVPITEVRALFERQSQTLLTGAQSTNQMCQFQIELTRGHKFKDTSTYRDILFNAGLRLTDVTGSERPEQGSISLNIEALETCDTLFLVVSNLVPGRVIYENSGPRPSIVERLDPATVPLGQVVYGRGSKER
jgi:hypothetical protein